MVLDSTSTGDILESVEGELEDGVVTDLLGNPDFGRDVLLGDIRPNTSRSVTWTNFWTTEGNKTFAVAARSDNWVDKNATIAVVVDGTAPLGPTNLYSLTHPIGLWSSSNVFTVHWTQPQDALSGVQGHGVLLSSAPAMPAATLNLLSSSYTGMFPGTSGAFYLNIRTVDRSGNWSPNYATYGPMGYDALQPNSISGLASATHAVNSFRCDGNVTVTWNPMTDVGGSGMAGGSWHWDNAPATVPDAGLEGNASATSFTTLLAPSTQPWYFHIRPFDNAGNGQNAFHYGPIYITSASPLAYCTGKTNSLGCVPAISSTGTPSISSGNLQVQCSNALNQKSGLLFFGSAPNAAPFQGGTLCIAAPFVRTATQFSNGAATGNSCTGSYSFTFTPQVYTDAGIVPGDTVYAQWWMRDPASPSTTGLSNALRFTTCQ